jgi:hypothetical protein
MGKPVKTVWCFVQNVVFGRAPSFFVSDQCTLIESGGITAYAKLAVPNSKGAYDIFYLYGWTNLVTGKKRSVLSLESAGLDQANAKSQIEAFNQGISLGAIRVTSREAVKRPFMREMIRRVRLGLYQRPVANSFKVNAATPAFS